jgi:hypothetical protein
MLFGSSTEQISIPIQSEDCGACAKLPFGEMISKIAKATKVTTGEDKKRRGVGLS